MDIEKYLEKMKTIQNALLDLYDSENDKDIKYQSFIELIEQLQIKDNSNEVRSFLHLLSKISKNHRDTSCFVIIEKILTYLNDAIHLFLNSEIFTIFKSNKKILLFLIKSKMLIIDQFVISKLKSDKYSTFFFPEIKNHLTKEKIEEISKSISDDFEINRQIGENDSYICQFIRNDSINEFISYINKANIQLTSEIPSSIYETNSFLIKHKNTTLIEYATFFGSIQIFKYMKINIQNISKSIWSYAIHSNNPEIIHLLEECNISSYQLFNIKSINESIKCFHNNIANYIINISDISPLVSKCLKYYNFEYIEKEDINETQFFNFCIFDYPFFVGKFLNNKNVNQIVGESKNNLTPIYFAIKKNNTEIVKLLLFINVFDINYIFIRIKFFMKFS